MNFLSPIAIDLIPGWPPRHRKESLLLSTKWITWQQVASLIQADDAARVLQAVEQLVDVAVSAGSTADFLRTLLPELAGELAANSIGVFLRTPDWIALAQHGRVGLSEMPKSLLMDVVDRDAGFVGPLDGVPGTFLAATPLRSRTFAGAVLAFVGRSFPDDVLPSAMLISKAVGACLDFLEIRGKSTRRIEQLQSILKICQLVHHPCLIGLPSGKRFGYRNNWNILLFGFIL